MRPALPSLNRSNTDDQLVLARKGTGRPTFNPGLGSIYGPEPAPLGLQNSAPGLYEVSTWEPK